MEIPAQPNCESEVMLREITIDTLNQLCELAVAPEQQVFVAANTFSIAQAYFVPEAWFRGIYAGDTPVGFVMIHDDPKAAEYHLWRFMIDARYQRHGFGRRALELVIDHVRTRPGATKLSLSYVPKEGNPAPFYAKLGFRETGEEKHGERVMLLEL